MQNDFRRPDKPELVIPKEVRDENGLRRLAAYYQSLFDIEENFNYYTPDDYQNAKRKFVKHLMHHRSL